MLENNRHISRRDFIRIIGTLGGVAALWKFGLDTPDPQLITKDSRYLMGTVVNLTLVGSVPDQAHTAISACLNRMAELEAVLSRFQPQSQLSKLNQAGVLHDAHPALVSLIRRSMGLGQLTGGAFDITVLPVLSLYEAKPGSLPTSRQIDQALELVDYRKLEISGQSIILLQPGMSITLDAIAKGFIVDEGVAVLKEYGFENVLVQAAGDGVALGEKSAHSPWMIGLQNPRAAMGNLITIFKIQNEALATSGDYWRTFTPDFANNHILDPRTGRSPVELASASIFGPTTAALADGLATSVMVMGKEGLQLVEQLAGYKACLVTKDLTILKTVGFHENK
jgi:thiamine biosynthesis lipoprotein